MRNIYQVVTLYSAKLGERAVVILDVTRKKESKAVKRTGENKCISFSFFSACGGNYWGKKALTKNLIWPKEHINYNFVVVYFFCDVKRKDYGKVIVISKGRF